MTVRHVAIVGGGYSGALQAINLLRHGTGRVTLIEREDRLARGVAYSTPHPEHLLNVRAASMSAFAHEPAHFADWLSLHGGTSHDFAQRRLYGAYLEELLAEAGAAAGERLQRLRGEAVNIAHDGEREVVQLATGETIAADAAILSVGNLAPPVPNSIPSSLLDRIYVADPWTTEIAAGLGRDSIVLLIGTGLTSIDAALTLDAAGFEGRILALSRRGLVPRAHAEPGGHPVPLAQAPEPICSALVRRVRSDAGSMGWRAAIDQLRPVTQQLWASASPAARARFLRHLRPYWDVHRHRIAPEIAAKIERIQREERLRFAAGKITDVSPNGDRAAVRWRPRGATDEQQVKVDRIVNCTGPEGNIARAGEPLLRNLVAAGRIRPDVCRIGIDIDASNRTIDASGRPSDSLLAIGPMTRGALWEIVAVPDLRNQTDRLAARLAA